MKKRVLIADDKEENLYFLRALLQGHGYDVDEASQGTQALVLAQQSPPDLIISDILMPVMDGFALCREWKRDERLRQIPFIFYTATYTDERDREFALSLGAERFVIKPEEPDTLVAMVRDLIRHAERPPRVQEPVPASRPAADQPKENSAYLKQYNAALLRKLEAKMGQLELANRTLERDIDERKQAEKALRASEQRYREVFNATSEAIFIDDALTGRLLDVNESMLRLYGYASKEEVLAGNIGDLSANQSAYSEEQAQRRVAAAVAGEPQQFEWLAKRRDGTVFPAEVTLRRSVIGGHDRVLAVVRDVTARKKAEADHVRLIAAIEQSGETIVITDSDGVIQYVNPAFVTATGYTREEAVGQNPRLLKSGQQGDAFYRELWSAISSGKSWTGRFSNKRKDGKLFTEEATISPVCDKSGKIVNYVAVKRDISLHLQLSEQLYQAQKMESIGRLAGGVAHDFNNMLGVILGNTELALLGVDPSEQLYADLQEIHRAAERSAELTRQLLAFARKQTIEPQVIDLNEAVTLMIKMLRRLIGEDVDLIWHPGKGLWPVKIDPIQVDQLLANLSVNARDAIVEAGHLIIETRNATVDETYCAQYVEAVPGEYVLLEVSDNGCGMDTTVLEHLFEPFFTTKDIGSGTGLGLSTVYGIVKQNDGFINVSSEPGHGTSFKIYLPRYAEEVSQLPC
jgi:PAS domain S-box-containing protein